jgi:membrane associated rhomboid family serine protease
VRITYLLIVLNVLIYAAMLGVAGAHELAGFSNATLTQFGSLSAAAIRAGQWWRLVTAMFIHLTPMHIAFNMIAVWQAGSVLELHYGRVRFVFLYLIAGLGGWAASLAWNWHSYVNVAGASGAISGLIGAGVVAGHLAGGPKGKHFRDGMLRWMFFVIVFGLVIGNVDHAAHIGGFVVGGVVAWLLHAGARASRVSDAKAHSTAAVGFEHILLVALVGGAFALSARAKGAELDPGELINRGVELARAGKDAEAIPLYRRAIELEPREKVAHLDLADALYQTRDYDGALAEARATLAIDANYTNAWAVLCNAYVAKGLLSDADAAKARFVELGGKPELLRASAPPSEAPPSEAARDGGGAK